VRINDRGPFTRGRVIDLSRVAADQLGMRHDGVARVRIEPLGTDGEGCPFRQALLD
jgi:rare lipoprotein A